MVGKVQIASNDERACVSSFGSVILPAITVRGLEIKVLCLIAARVCHLYAPDDLARIGVNIKEIMNEKLLGNVEQ